MMRRPRAWASALLLLLLSFSNLYSTRALKVNLLDTLNATSELNWRTYSNQDEKDGWLEETTFSRTENRNHQAYSTCNQEPDHEVENWLLVPAVERGDAQRLHLDFNFTIIRCAAVAALRTSGSCRETLRLYAVQLAQGEALATRNWHNETNWEYVDTLVSHSSDTAAADPGEEQRTYTQTSSYAVAPATRAVQFALRNTGACSSILSLRIYYNVCPEQQAPPSLLQLPRTVAARDAHGVLSVPGTCAPNAAPVMPIATERGRRHTARQHAHQQQQFHFLASLSPPTAICKADGSWQVLGPTECACEPGHIASLKSGMCTACGPGTFKAAYGPGECLPCPEHSWSNRSGSEECACLPGFQRAKGGSGSEDVAAPCIAVSVHDGHLSHIQSAISSDSAADEADMGPDGGRIPSQRGDSAPEDLLSRLFGAQSWPWVLVCVLVILSLCVVLCLLSRQNSARNGKQMSDLDVLDNYKQDTISPDYSRSLAGGCGMMGGQSVIGGCLGKNQHNSTGTFLRKKMHTPLIRSANGGVGTAVGCYGTQPRCAVGGVLIAAAEQGQTGMPLSTAPPHFAPCGSQQPLRVPPTPACANFRAYVDPTTYANPIEVLSQFTNEIRAEDVEVTRVIGAGEFGEVCCGRLSVEDAYGQRQQQIVAVKTLLPGSGPKAKADFLLEASIMGQFQHDNVIHLIGVVTRTEPVMILTEYMLYGSLDQFLRTNSQGKLSMFHLVKMLHGVASGMKYLNDKGYVHRDLAARNVLVDDRLTCKIADFGLSRGLRKCDSGSGCSLEQQGEYTTQQGGKIPIRWTAPEAIMQHKYSTASDVWSFGVVMWEVLSFGERPYWDWSNQRVIQEVVHAGFRLPAAQDTPKRLHEMMHACWAAERHRRPQFGELVDQLAAFLNDVHAFYNYI